MENGNLIAGRIILFRNCPICGNVINYMHEIDRKKAEFKNTPCRKCMYEERKILYSGKNNPFYNKKHSIETKQLMSDLKTGKPSASSTKYKKGNIPHGKSNYLIWLEKYGKDVADKKLLEFKKKQSINSIGSKNPMYGKPSPNGSGNGWSGWYNNWFFRSLLELSYMINIIERFNLHWQTGEQQKYKIKYIDYKHQERNYFPDFIINEKYIIECKPKKLFNSTNVVAKQQAGIKYAKEHNMIYKIRSIKKLTIKEITELRKKGLIKFTDRYELKFKEQYESN